MKKRIIIAAFCLIVIIILFVNSFIVMEYNQNVIDYLVNNEKLTKSDKEWLKENGPFLYAADNNSPPLRFKDKETGDYQGIVVDYIVALSIELGVEIDVKPMIWKEALISLENNESDLCDMFPSQQRQEKFVFTNPLYYVNGVLITSKDNDEIKTYKDLVGKKMAIQKGDYIEEFLNAKVEKIDFFYTDDYQESLRLLKEGKVDVTGGDEPVLSYFLKEMNLDKEYIILEKPIYEMPMIFAISKDNIRLKNIINKAIVVLNKKDTMKRIQQKWFGISRTIIEDNNYEILRLFTEMVIGIFVIASIIIYFWNRELVTKINLAISKENIAKMDLEIIFNNLPYYFIIVNENEEILKINIPFAEFVDKNVDEIIGTKVSMYEGVSHIKLNFNEDEISKHEFSFHEKNYLISSVVLPETNKDEKRNLLIIEDITNAKLQEEQLLHSNKIAALGQLAAGITHEIRNPIGLIRNYIYIIKNKLYLNKREYMENINGIDNALDSVNRFIDNLLNFSRISSGEKEVICLKDFFDSINKLTVRNLEKINVSLTFKDEECEVYFNKESLKHIFFNLISNASDSIIQNGEINISCSNNENGVVIIVADTGKGIKKENLDKVFKPFFTTKYPEKGTGLGLNIVYKEIKKNGGDIKVESEYFKGAKFIITLPYKGD